MRSLGILVTCVTFGLVGCGDDSAPGGNDGAIDGEATDGGTDASTSCEPVPAPEMCDFFTGCGCDVAGGQKCSIGPESKRCALAGDRAEGELCTDDGQCAAGTGCVVYPTGGGDKSCMRFCDASHACPTAPSEEACYIDIVNTSDQTIGKVCGEVCNLLAQDCDFDGQNCHVFPSVVSTAELGACVAAGPGVQGDSCATDNCAEGFICITPSGSTDPICAELCAHANGNADCGDSLTCSSLAGHTATGICLP
jgi:hypothetical protein